MSRSFLYLGLSGLAGLSLVLSDLPKADLAMAEVVQPVPTENQMIPSDEAQIRQLTSQWFATWSPGPNPMDWDAMGELFAQSELLVFDDAGGRVVVLTSWDDYRATWEPFMAQFSEWQIEPEGDIQVRVAGDLATTVFTLTGGGIDQEGNAISFRQRGTHIWQRTGDRWAIVHEHLTTDS
ncbi:MAG: nuclear transport factor 2 family protein [Cyanobacteria bacterium P01_F01_bin.116]